LRLTSTGSCVMEVRVEVAGACCPPPGCFVGVRIGEVLKQGRYEPQRCYSFPPVARRRSAKIDLYQHMGSCVVAVDPAAGSTREVTVACSGQALRRARLQVSVRPAAGDPKQEREGRTKARKGQAEEYLSRHGIQERLSEAVKALLREQPADPAEFLCGHLCSSQPACLEPAGPRRGEFRSHLQPVTAPAPDAARVACLRQRARGALARASAGGQLGRALHEALAEAAITDIQVRTASLLIEAARSGALDQALRSLVVEAPTAPRPRQPMLLSTMSRLGPAFGLGLPYGLTCVC